MAPQTNKPGTRHTRHEIHQPARLLIPGADGDGQAAHEATVVDFSFSGVRIASHNSLDGQDEVGLQLLCNGEAQSQIVLHTRWSRPLEGGGYHHGMQFAEEGALLPFLGLDLAEYSTRLEAGPDADTRQGVLQVHESTRVGKIERLRCRVQGDLEVDQGLCHTNLTVEGRLNVTGGAVTGGQAAASMRMDLNEAGDSSGTPTRLCLAYLSDATADVHKRALLHLSRDQAHVVDCKKRIESFNGEDGEPSHDDREEVMALMFELQAKEGAVEALTEKISLLEGLIARKTCGELSVREVIHPGVKIGLHGKPECYETTKAIPGPVFIRADETGALRYTTDDGGECSLDQDGVFRRCG